ncbi:MAG TPA: hypothetical protein VFC25_17920 [Verrucomicrobiae bacterium]|nr:hypothetical protein [Verrucomicrobiae bacterium]
MRRGLSVTLVAAMVFLLAGALVRADDLTGAQQILCTAVQATKCAEEGDCYQDLPWNLNVPQFIQVDMVAKRLSTTKASGENRSTPIEYLKRTGGVIVLQGFEGGRAFSFVISEGTGMLSAAVAAEGKAVVVFGACTINTAAPGR